MLRMAKTSILFLNLTAQLLEDGVRFTRCLIIIYFLLGSCIFAFITQVEKGNFKLLVYRFMLALAFNNSNSCLGSFTLFLILIEGAIC
jgi:hypothetical protein